MQKRAKAGLSRKGGGLGMGTGHCGSVTAGNGVRGAGMMLAPPAVLPSRPCTPRSGASRCGSSSRRFLGPPFPAGFERGFRGAGGTACRHPGPGIRLMITEYQGRA